RLPHLEDRYEETFREPASVIHCGHFEVAVYEGRSWLELSMHHYGLKQDREVFRKFIVELRRKFNFLNEWRFVKAEWYDAVVSILFASATGAEANQSQEKLYETARGFGSDSVQVLHAKELTEKYIAEKTGPVSGNLVKGDTWVIEPYEDLTLSEMSLHYCAMFILGSLVRYYPNIWTNVLSRRADDKVLPLIESFINLTTIRFPAMVTNAIREPYGSK
ncbi:MAG TPA: YaaC family protein, partial [Nitrospira sp.]|nr:YaaC family protein [Nitrospira sp.]